MLRVSVTAARAGDSNLHSYIVLPLSPMLLYSLRLVKHGDVCDVRLKVSRVTEWDTRPRVNVDEIYGHSTFNRS